MNITNIDYDEFMKMDIRVGLVMSCISIPKSNNLYKLVVDCGEIGLKQIITGINKFYSKEELIGTKIILLVNLKHRTIMGEISEGMLLAADYKGEPFLLRVDEKSGREIPPGSKIK